MTYIFRMVLVDGVAVVLESEVTVTSLNHLVTPLTMAKYHLHYSTLVGCAQGPLFEIGLNRKILQSLNRWL